MQSTGSTATGTVCTVHALQQTTYIPTPPAGGAPAATHRASSADVGDANAKELAVGANFHDRPPPMAQGAAALATGTRYSHLFEPPLDFEKFSERTLPVAPQAQYMGHTLSPQECARMLRLALSHMQKLVKMGSLHPAAHMTWCGALIPLGGQAVCGLNKRPYFTCTHKMIGHIHTLAQYCEATWITRSHARLATQRPYV